MPSETRVVGRCDRCGAPVYVQAEKGAPSARIEFPCGHDP